MRKLPRGSVDHNLGGRVRNRRKLNSLQNRWPYGFAFFFFQAEDGIRDGRVTGVQTCALPISDTVLHKSGTAGLPNDCIAPGPVSLYSSNRSAVRCAPSMTAPPSSSEIPPSSANVSPHLVTVPVETSTAATPSVSFVERLKPMTKRRPCEGSAMTW